MHSTNSFPTHTGAEFLEFLKVAGSGDKAAVEEFLGRHPETKRFLETEKPSPESFTTERFWGVNAFIFVNGKGEKRAFRYQVLPAEEVKHLSPEEVKPKPENYLFDDISARLSSGQPAEFKLVAQLSEEGDVTDNATVLWPEEREIVELGTIKLEKEVETEESKKEQKYIIFDPIPRVEGIEPSADPLLETRANVYLVSGRERRAAA
ncbi:heme-dependent catalase [Delitschia confertaspora ATCC 74209]|uniref:Heme-dependent catalase n=1 Tax=Delitschia confertaspora ATCC 74209 TaxID=1513339 RepID=A0A9P4N0H4_9PLEO|nr:heme-dependent catalase [Delitschia confertaspora ATCC 74209]